MQNYIKFIELLNTLFKSTFFKVLKKCWKKCWAIALLSLGTIIVMAALIGYISIHESVKMSFVNREANDVIDKKGIHNYVKAITKQSGHGVTFVVMTITAKNLHNNEKELRFITAFSNKEGTVFNSMHRNRSFFEKVYQLSHKEGTIFERDEYQLNFAHDPKPFIEKQAISIPIFDERLMETIEMVNLKIKMKVSFNLLIEEGTPLPINSVRNLHLAKNRDIFFKNSRVIFLIAGLRSEKSKNGFNPNEIKSGVTNISNYIGNTISLF